MQAQSFGGKGMEPLIRAAGGGVAEVREVAHILGRSGFKAGESCLVNSLRELFLRGDFGVVMAKVAFTGHARVAAEQGVVYVGLAVAHVPHVPRVDFAA